ncbi:MAG: PH domain-containing protein [Lentisphaeria bacterium]|nr:PH domain-containing protein [Lentisphaeria bacterium]
MANSADQQVEEGYQLCPFCKEKIRIGARKCRWCMEYLDASDAEATGVTSTVSAAAEAPAENVAIVPETKHCKAPQKTRTADEKAPEVPSEEEVVHFKMHPTYKRLLPPLIIAFAVIILSVPFLKHMDFSMYVLLLVIAFCLIWFMKLFIGILTTTYLLDDRRLVVSEGFFTRQRVEIRIEDIRAVWLKQNIIEQLLNIGDVQVGTSATAGAEISIADIDAPMEVHDLLRTLMD